MPVQINVHAPAISVLVPAASTASSENFVAEDLFFNLVDSLLIHGI
jgi:hypothetical protein